MNVGVGDFLRKRRSVARPTACADEPVIFPGASQRPSWATATGMFEALGGTLSDRDLGDTQPLSPLAIENAPPLLDRRTPMTQAAAVSWQTHYGETVTIGDLVALQGLTNRDAKGRIVAAAVDGRPECVIGDDPRARSPRLTVDADNLLALLRRGGGEPIDTKRL